MHTVYFDPNKEEIHTEYADKYKICKKTQDISEIDATKFDYYSLDNGETIKRQLTDTQKQDLNKENIYYCDDEIKQILVLCATDDSAKRNGKTAAELIVDKLDHEKKIQICIYIRQRHVDRI